jgi:curved DNA-binding protein
MVAGWQAGEGRGRDAQEGPSPEGAPGRGARSADGSGGFDFHFEGTGFSDFFEQFFGSRADATAGRAGPRGARPVAMRQGHDIEGDILITLDEVLAGAMRNIAVRRIDPRTGQETTAQHAVRIPPGVHTGQSIRVPGMGGEGIGGGSAGDIYLRVRYAEHPDWSVDGANLLGELRLAPWEAVLGATVPVHTLEGTISVKVPAGTQQGHRLRVRGKGLPLGSVERGDLYVEVAIQVPARVCREDEVLWRQLAAQSAFDPRKG